VGLYKLNPVETHSLTAPGFNPSAWSVSEYVFGVQTSKLTRHLSTYSKEYVKPTRPSCR
jgi:hypothetical protein